MAEDQEPQYSQSQLVTLWEEFFKKYNYDARIQSSLDGYPDKRSLVVEFWELGYFDADFEEYVLARPKLAILAAERVLQSFMPPDRKVPIHVRVRNLPPKTGRIKIRGLRAEHLHRFVAVEGLIRRATEVRPKLEDAYFECLRCHAVMRVPQEDITTFREPLECSKDDSMIYVGEPGCGRAATSTSFKLLTERSRFVDTQEIVIQEMPEELRGGEQPQHLTVYLDDDMTGIVNPGDRVVFNGVLMSRQRGHMQKKTNIFDIHLECISLEKEDRAYDELDITDEDLEKIEALAHGEDIYRKLENSIAPTIYGLGVEKRTLALQLFGGVTKEMPDRTHIRGDIHVLMVGDPGTAKSQLLRYISQMSPRGVYASGKAATAAGLTATAVQDNSPMGQGRWNLEAGALVLADRGLCCIDEIDKMSKEDRSSMHEAMEQQRISVAKAGINATLQSRCSILAAANPKMGRFEEFRGIADQIDLPPTLLSRFDVIFMIQDKPDTVKDTALADHVLRSHHGGEMRMHRKNVDDEQYSSQDIEKALASNQPEIANDIMRKYVAHAKRTCFPVMTPEAVEEIKRFYVNLRSKYVTEEPHTVPITARQLEAIVRLSEAAARVRLDPQVRLGDARMAIQIVEYFLKLVAQDSGVMDIDSITTGISHSQRANMNVILGIIQDINESKNKDAEKDAILNQAVAQNIEKAAAEDILAKLQSQGRIYKPKEGKYRVVPS